MFKAFYYFAFFEKKNNAKQLWVFIDFVIHAKLPTTCLPFRANVDSNKTDDPNETSEIFNDCFVKIGESIQKKREQ